MSYVDHASEVFAKTKFQISPSDGAILLKPYTNELVQFRYKSGTYGSKKSFVRSEHTAEQEGTRLDRNFFYQNESNASAALRAYQRMKT